MRSHPRVSLRENVKTALDPALEKTLRSSLWAPLDFMLRRSLIPCLEAALRERLRYALRWELRDKRGSSLLNSLLAMMGTFLRSPSPGPPRPGAVAARGGDGNREPAGGLERLFFGSNKNPVKIQSSRMWGQHDFYRISLYLFCREIGVRFAADDDRWLGFFDEVARSAMWWWPFENLSVVSERPEMLRLDEAGRPHCPSGPAVAFRDGWRVWAWHGVQVRRKIIETPVNPLSIDLERNAEVRRVLIERCGWEAYIEATGAEVIHTDEVGDLLEKTVGRDITVRLARVVNGTPEPDGSHKRHLIPVPLESQSCREGIAATYGLQAGEYRNIVRT